MNKTAVVGFKYQETQTKLSYFLEICNVYRRFVPNFSRVATPLNKLIKKGESILILKPSVEEQSSFDLLKSALVAPPVLRLPQTNLPFSVDTDACKEKIRFGIFQEYDSTR